MNIDEINIGSLAYLGDSIYEVMIRKNLLLKNNVKSNMLQKMALNYVSATNQSKIIANEDLWFTARGQTWVYLWKIIK